MNAESPYVRGLLDKIGVKPDIITCGDYKTAGEVFMRKGPSPEAKRMTDWLLDSLYDSFQKMVAKGRGVRPERVRQWVDGALYTPEQARQLGIIDSVQHRQDFEAELRKEFGEDVKFDRKMRQEARRNPSISPRPWGSSSSGPARWKGERRSPPART